MDKTMINKINSNNSFSGIRLSSSKFEHVREVAFYLQRTGFENLGHKTFYINNDTKSKISTFKNFRNSTYFNSREFGAVILPWSNEAFIVAAPDYEQFMLPVVKHIDNKACINLLI
jgi:hypothetical protein